MRSAPIIAVAVCFAFAFAVLGGAGWTAATGGSSGSGVVDSVSDTSNSTNIGVEGTGGQSDDGDIFAFIINSARYVDDIVLLGLTVAGIAADLGVPRYVTQPIGWVTQLVLAVGFFQFVANRVLR